MLAAATRFGDSLMSSQQLMAALMSRNRCEGKVLRVGLALERLGIHGQQIFGRRESANAPWPGGKQRLKNEKAPPRT